MKKIKPILRANIFFLILVLISIFGPYVLGPILLPLKLSVPVTLILTHIIMFIIPAILYIVITKQSFKKVLRLNKIGFKEILIALAIGFIAQPVMAFFSYIASFFFTNDVSGMLTNLNSTPLWLMILMIGVTPAISEEITMRGIVLSGYDFKNKHVAALMSGLMFGILHMNMHQFMYAFAMGAIFGYMVRAANSIYVAMIAHFTINTSQLLLQRMIFKAQEMMGGQALDPNQAMEMLNSLSWVQKIASGLFYLAIAVVGGLVIRELIKALENIRRKRLRFELESNSEKGFVSVEQIEKEIEPAYENSYIKENIGLAELRSEKIINPVFIVIVIIYIIYMFI